MFKKLLAACAIVISLAPQVYASPNWELVGKTNDGETLSLDTSSVQTKLNAGEWLFFSYKVGNRQNIAKTASCSNGKLHSAKPGYIVDSTSRQAYADSVGSQNMLHRVCQIGKNAYSISDYPNNSESYQTVNNNSNVSTKTGHYFVESLDYLLISKNNPLVHQYNGNDKIKNGNLYCQYRKQGGSLNSYLALIDDSLIKEGATKEQREDIMKYQLAIGIVSHHYLCTEFKDE